MIYLNIYYYYFFDYQVVVISYFISLFSIIKYSFSSFNKLYINSSKLPFNISFLILIIISSSILILLFSNLHLLLKSSIELHSLVLLLFIIFSFGLSFGHSFSHKYLFLDEILVPSGHKL